MMKLFVFTKKEFVENARTYKVLITLLVFMLFGFINPITAKLMPELLSSFMPDGMTITITEPTALDSWTQFFKNIPTQLILVIIIFSSILVTEYHKGTLINVITKGVQRKFIIISKFLFLSMMWSISYVLCFIITYGYTVYLFPSEIHNILFSASCMWLFGILILATLLLGSVIFTQMYGVLLFTGGLYLLGLSLSLFPNSSKYNPIELATANMNILQQTLDSSELYLPIIVTISLITIIILISCILFNRKEI